MESLENTSLLLDDPSMESAQGAEAACSAYIAYLLGPDGTSVGPCRTSDLSELGLRLRAPVACGVGVGQRYEISIRPVENSEDELAGEGHYVTVVQTCFLGQADRECCLQVGVRFDRPMFLS